MDIVHGTQARAPNRVSHPAEVGQVYERLLAGTAVRSRYVGAGTGGRVHLLEKGAGPPVVLLYGSGVSAGFFMPLLNEFDGVRAMAPDRPGQGLSDPIDLPRNRLYEATINWLDQLLDAVEVPSTVLLGHSGGGVLALRYALARPDRVRQLVLAGPPALPGTRCPLPYRVIATPGVGDLLPRLAPPSPKSAVKFARFMGEGPTLASHPDLVDMFVAAGRDPIAVAGTKAEYRVLVSPFALLSRSGFRRRSRVRAGELRQLTMPTLLIWGEREPLGGVPVAQEIAQLIPRAELAVLPGGHAPWLGHPARTAEAVMDFVR